MNCINHQSGMNAISHIHQTTRESQKRLPDIQSAKVLASTVKIKTLSTGAQTGGHQRHSKFMSSKVIPKRMKRIFPTPPPSVDHVGRIVGLGTLQQLSCHSVVTQMRTAEAKGLARVNVDGEELEKGEEEGGEEKTENDKRRCRDEHVRMWMMIGALTGST